MAPPPMIVRCYFCMQLGASHPRMLDADGRKVNACQDCARKIERQKQSTPQPQPMQPTEKPNLLKSIESLVDANDRELEVIESELTAQIDKLTKILRFVHSLTGKTSAAVPQSKGLPAELKEQIRELEGQGISADEIAERLKLPIGKIRQSLNMMKQQRQKKAA